MIISFYLYFCKTLMADLQVLIWKFVSRCFTHYNNTLIHLHKGTLNAPTSKHTYTHWTRVEVEQGDDSAREIWKL